MNGSKLTTPNKFKFFVVARPLNGTANLGELLNLMADHQLVPYSEADSGRIAAVAHGDQSPLRLTVTASQNVFPFKPTCKDWQVFQAAHDDLYWDHAGKEPTNEYIERLSWRADQKIEGEKTYPQKYLQAALIVPRSPYSTFPIDMLRYDHCFPFGRGSADHILKTFDNPFKELIGVYVSRFSETARDNPWTEGRWQSFGWTVEEADIADLIRKAVVT